MRMDHAIFSTPNNVKLTIEERPTPASYAHYADGKDLGEAMQMWRVQTEGYLEGKGQLVGVVSRDTGFLDSPDTEWISGGVNSKGPNAVAIGRHGNFFHWGFAASPKYMTEEGKLVLVNALHYIARFDGQTPMVRKRQGDSPRAYVEQALDSISDEAYAETLARYAKMRVDDAERREEVQARINAGEEVSEMDQRRLTYPEIEDPGRMDRIERYLPAEFFAQNKDNPIAITAFVNENLPYYRPSGWYEMEVDEELKSFGIGSNDPQLIARLVEARRAKDSELAQTLLVRYTSESFTTAEGWATWFLVNSDRMFFTESGGYKWMVNTLNESPLRANPKNPLATRLTREPIKAGGKNGHYRFTLSVDILAGWHAYDQVPAGSPFIPITLKLELPKGAEQVTEWTRPASYPDRDNPDLTVYEGTLEFTCEVAPGQAEDLHGYQCSIKYQVCDMNMCLPPATKTIKLFTGRKVLR
jgi:hypothetical protein